MSASRQHKKRIEERAQAALNPKKKQDSGSVLRKVFISTVSVVVLLGFLFLFLSGLGIFEANLTVLTVGDVEIKASEYNYHYFSAIAEESYLYQYSGMTVPFDTSKSLKTQKYSETKSWEEYFEEITLENLTTVVLQSEQAKAEGIVLTEADYEEIQSVLDSLKSAAENDGTSEEKALRNRYGRGITMEKFNAYVERRVLSKRYKTDTLESFERTDEDFENYYKENRNNYDSVKYHSYLFAKMSEESDAEDAPTAEEVEDYNKELKEKAEDMLSKVTSSSAFLTLTKEYEDVGEDAGNDEEGEEAEEEEEEEGDPTLYESAVSDLSEPYIDYLSSTARVSRDKTLLEDDDNYYVVLFVSRSRDTTVNADVRHILAAFPDEEDDAADEENTDDEDADTEDADTDDEVSEEVKASTKARADALLDEWKAGDQTSESFAAIATENTEDEGSAEDGGLYTNVSPTSNYVEPFLDWIFKTGRRVGDTGVVETIYGYHVMYLDKFYPPQWEVDVKEDMDTADYDAIYEEISEGKDVNTNGFAMFFTKRI